MKLSKASMNGLMMGTMLAINPESVNQTREKVKDPLEGIDIDSEYLLIQIKKSKLTARMRMMVTFRHDTIKTAQEREKATNNEEE